MCIDKGSLGGRCISSLNKALLCKCIWRYAPEWDVVWKSVIGGIYGEEEGGDVVVK